LTDSLSTSYTFTKGVIRGIKFRARYRVKNAVGWSADYSPVGYIIAADEPSTPDAPTVTSTSSTTIDLAIWPSYDNQGSTVTLYELYMDDGAAGSFSIVGGYDGVSSTYTLD
jgi:hypothetical protein